MYAYQNWGLVRALTLLVVLALLFGYAWLVGTWQQRKSMRNERAATAHDARAFPQGERGANETFPRMESPHVRRRDSEPSTRHAA